MRMRIPPAKFWRVPESAMPTASPAAPRMATKEVIGKPAILAQVMIKRTLSDIDAKL